MLLAYLNKESWEPDSSEIFDKLSSCNSTNFSAVSFAYFLSIIIDLCFFLVCEGN
jgi:hypothetical protein